MGFLLAEANLPFTAALALMLLIGASRPSGLAAGTPRGRTRELEADADSGPAALLDWLNAGGLPLLMLIVVFLFSFGLPGLILQRVWQAANGELLPIQVAAPVALAAALPVTRRLGRLLARVLPHGETTAVPRDSYVGRVAVVVTGTARAGHAAQARLRDEHGQRHYLMIEPAAPDEELAEGETALIVRRDGATFYAVRNDEPALQDARV
jgi:membrane protein implicated in regulation of membrane protease activity